ncbi:hypothetical protein [Streptomyces mirabilis]|uniref:hypothetical protein n=1 Tax=Streptomyces mirabilis TaxID=68239 RepID=UPI0033BF6506
MAAEVTAGEVSAVEDGAVEVEGELTPGGGCVRLPEVLPDDTDDGEPHLALAFLVPGFRGAGLVGHAEIGAQHIDADLLLFLPVVSEAGKGVDAGEADRRLIVAELPGGGCVAVGEWLASARCASPSDRSCLR